MGASLPFLTLPDPLVTGEGALDPLGLAVVGDHVEPEEAFSQLLKWYSRV
jgi:hypothetical protein